MPRARVHNLSVSLDGFAAGPDQSRDRPLGTGGEQLHEWIFATAYGRAMIGEPGGATGLDHDMLVQGDENIGATVMGRNMFGPIRGDWGDDTWTGWWGPTPPYHHPVFVITHHPHDPIEMDGGTTFHFVASLDAALERAFAAAGGRDVRIGGGASTVRQAMRRGLVDDVHLAIVPVLLGRGERLLDLADGAPAYECAEMVASPAVTHVHLTRSPAGTDH